MGEPAATGHVLELRIGDGAAATRVQVAEGDWHVIGSAADAAIRVGDPMVSRRHAAVRLRAGSVYVRDEGSRNGTFVDGRRLRANEEATLAAPAMFRIGELAMTCRALDADEAELGVALDEVAGTPSVDVPQAGVATLAPATLDPFTRLALPMLLARLADGCTRFEFTGLLAASCREHLPIRALEVLDRRDAGRADEAASICVYRTEPAPAADAVERELLGLDWRIAWDPVRAPLGESGLWTLLEGLLRLAVDPPSRVQAVPEPREPDPPSRDPAMRALYRRAAQAARGDIHVLIRGESGTGKEVLARYLHEHGDPARPFVAVNCAALPQDLLEAELFGVEKGVATGVDARAGVFERADGGTLFLDEIGDMALPTQARILRVLQEREVSRIGARQARPARVRVIAATHQPLEAMVADGRFRLDLFHRIADWEAQLPPLRERVADIAPLSLHFLARHAAARSLRVRGISRRALDCLQAHDWPGNVRELEREIARIVVFLDDGAAVTAEDLGPVIRGSAAVRGTLEERLAAQERRWIEQALGEAGGKVDEAARALGISRSTLYRKLGAAAEPAATDCPGRASR